MEGPRFTSDYMKKYAPLWIILSEDATPDSRETAEDALEAGIDVLEIPVKLFSGISDTLHSQGIIAVCPLPVFTEDDIRFDGTFLLLDRISDPGNIGTIIRSAAAFGCTTVIMGEGCCCPFTPKVTRASTGLNSRIPLLFNVDLPSFLRRHRKEYTFIGADASGGSIAQIRSSSGPVGIVIGSEAHGISDQVREQLDTTVSIPMKEGVESINAAVSASILLYEIIRI